MYKVEVPDTARSGAFETNDIQIQVTATLCGVPDFAYDNVRMVHRVPKTKYVATKWDTGEKFDKFLLWTYQGKLTDAQLEELHSNEMFIDYFYDSEPIDLTSLWFKLPEQLEELDDDVQEENT